MNFSSKNILAFCILLVSLISVNQWSIIPIGITVTDWILYLTLSVIFVNGYFRFHSTKDEHIFPIKYFVIWSVICIIRGFFEAENYWDWKNLISTSFVLLLPLSVYLFTSPIIVQTVLSLWFKIALPLFVFFLFLIPHGAYGFFLAPIMLIVIFLPILRSKWQIIILICILTVLTGLSNRSSLLKYGVALIFSMIYYFPLVRFYKTLIYFRLVFLLLPLLLFSLQFYGIFNIFQMDEFISGNYTAQKVIKGEINEESLTADSRTFLYEEVIKSAINNDYVIMGRTPARGNDSERFGAFLGEELETGRYERHSNEVSIQNIFTWIGLVGVILYFIIFFKSSYLAIVKSNNHFIKILGLYVSFRWTYAWVEDANRVDITNIILWIMIAMCFSRSFREMTNLQFKIWIYGIFNKKYSLGFIKTVNH